MTPKLRALTAVMLLGLPVYSLESRATQTSPKPAAAARTILTAQGTNGSHEFKLTITQGASGAYQAIGSNFAYVTEFSVRQDPSGIYQVAGKTLGLFGATGQTSTLTLTKDGTRGYILKGVNSTYDSDVTISADASGAYRAKGRNLSYESDLKITGSPTLRVEGTHGAYRSNITGKSAQAAERGPEMKEPLPLQVLMAIGSLVGTKGQGL